MYKPMAIEARAAQMVEITRILDQLETRVCGPLMADGQVSAADIAAFPLFTFLVYILPRFFGWKDVFEGRPKLGLWWERISSDESAIKVHTPKSFTPTFNYFRYEIEIHIYKAVRNTARRSRYVVLIRRIRIDTYFPY